MMNRIYFGNCLKVMPRIPDHSVDMILADLPYGTISCEWDNVIPIKPLWEQYKRICSGTIVLFSAQPFTSYIVNSNPEMFRYELIWIKNRPTAYLEAKNKPMPKHENILIFSQFKYSNMCRERMRYNPQGLIRKLRISKTTVSRVWGESPSRPKGKIYISNYTNYPTSILEFSKDKEKIHPTQKPVLLLEYLIKTYTNEGDLVLDNAAGSGTTGIACLNTKRRFILIEKDREYYEVMKNRLKEWRRDKC